MSFTSCCFRVRSHLATAPGDCLMLLVPDAVDAVDISAVADASGAAWHASRPDRMTLLKCWRTRGLG